MGRGINMLGLAVALATAAWATAASAGQDRPRLVVGGFDRGQAEALPLGGELRTGLLARGAWTIGALTDTAPVPSALALPLAGGGDRLALGSFVAYDISDYRLSSSLRGDADALSADLSAAYAGSVMGFDSIAAVRLGADWSRSAAFSLNPLQPGGAAYDAYRPAGDLSLSLSWSHEVTPSLNLSGIAAASRPMAAERRADTGGFMLGAGLGYRF